MRSAAQVLKDIKEDEENPPLDRIAEGYVSMSTQMHQLQIQVAELTHSLNYAAGGLSTLPHNSGRLPDEILKDLIDYGKKAHKEYQDA